MIYYMLYVISALLCIRYLMIYVLVVIYFILFFLVFWVAPLLMLETPTPL